LQNLPGLARVATSSTVGADMNAANPVIPLEASLDCEYVLTAEKEGHHLTGCEVGVERALAVARGLALAGWRVRVASSDPTADDPLVMDVWAEDVPE